MEVMGSNPIEALNFFRLLSNCLKDQSSLYMNSSFVASVNILLSFALNWWVNVLHLLPVVG